MQWFLAIITLKEGEFSHPGYFMKVSIITVALNNAEYIEACIQSVINQDYKNIEYIVVDGGSTDGTIDIINKYEDKINVWISEPDKGMYDAINKGIGTSSGDIIGILHSDDIYIDEHVIGNVVQEFRNNIDSVYADLVYVERNNIKNVVRYYDSSVFQISKFAYGWMPAHPTCFIKKAVYTKYGLYKTDFIIAADYELLVRFYAKHGVSYSYLPKVIVKMRNGGLSTRNFKSNIILNREIVRSCRENGIETNIFKVYSKYFVKMFQLFKKPRQI
jgi:glycosyltransferase involved in cell wall biosynthesis